jgi:hypothetical protein
VCLLGDHSSVGGVFEDSVTGLKVLSYMVYIYKICLALLWQNCINGKKRIIDKIRK